MDTYQVNIQEITKLYEKVRVKKDSLNKERYDLETKKEREASEASSLEKTVKKFRELESILKEKDELINHQSYLLIRLLIFGIMASLLLLLSFPTIILDVIFLVITMALGISTYNAIAAKRKVNKKLGKVKNKNLGEVQERLIKLEALLREKQNKIDNYQEEIIQVETKIINYANLLDQIHDVLKELYNKRALAIRQLVATPLGEEELNEAFLQDEEVIKLIRTINKKEEE